MEASRAPAQPALKGARPAGKCAIIKKMAERVDHTARKRDIALKATHLFSKVGYANVSLIQIAEAAGVARTILYRYFKDKREVFDASIRANTEGLLGDCLALAADPRQPTASRLRAVCCRIAEAFFDRHDFLVAVYDFVLTMVRQGEDMKTRIVRFTKGTRELLRRLVAAGVADGSIASATNKARAGSMLFGLLELSASRLVLGIEDDAVAAKCRLNDYIDLIAERP